MQLLTKKEFLDIKSSDTVVILGSGFSINNISEEQWNKIDSFDSIGFNWFCHHDFGPTYFLVREQANNKTRNVGTETRTALYKDINKPSYADTCIVVHKSMLKKNYCYARDLSRIHGRGIVVKDRKVRVSKKLLTTNIFKEGIVHGRCSLTNAMHLALFLKYKKIIFAGIDLYNSRYFWLGRKKTRSNIKMKGITYRHRHPSSRYVLPLIRIVKKNFDVNMSVCNKRSLLCREIPYEEL